MEELISVVIPIYNTARYLEECVDSLLAQTYRNLEIILVDDGSTDDSGLLCDEYAAADGRIRVIHQENGGLSAARNAGLAAARGRYIGFVDSDDRISSQMYERLHHMLVSNDADMVICDCHRFADGEACPEPILGEARIITAREALLSSLGPQGAVFNYAWNKLYKRELLNGIWFPTGKLNEDAFVAFRILHRSGKIIILPDRLYFYRVRESSITNADRYALTRDIYEVVEARMALFEAEGDAELVRACKREMLDWHIHRYLMGRRSSSRDRMAWQKHIASYRSYYSRYKVESRGLKYALFAFSPTLYALLSDMKNRKSKE